MMSKENRTDDQIIDSIASQSNVQVIESTATQTTIRVHHSNANRKIFRVIGSVALGLLAIVYLIPIVIVLMNSFKGRFNISDTPFALPNSDTFAGVSNYLGSDGVIESDGFLVSIGLSLFITVCSVAVIVFFTSMTAWFITRVKTWYTTVLYFLFVFSMIVPFQMVMFTMSKVANLTHLDNPVGIIVLYLGFGAGLSVFIFCGFVKAIPVELEEAAVIDGCNPWQVFIHVIFPVMRPTAITVAILNTMWIWNDYLLPYVTMGSTYKTIPIAVQYLVGGYGSVNMGAMMAALVLAMIPIVIFYLFGQKYIIKGVTAGAVKG
jgi:raffinose/stachyose/melibiose transport system permease protein